ncbi:MAG: nicotinamidase/pyrazinamidase [Sandaracinus sp.]|nr:nicotinamidase/pyrazinamidase [Sandaracinus sp.]|tara:strand:+ start:1487 stop:2116 length:630 start_codon:yes stop_codon:yes gene_type:complete
MTRALILVDIQNDFMPGGALAVPDGFAVVPVANALMPHFDLVVASQDWHPADHGSFASQHPGKAPGEMGELAGLPQVMWPDHCVQGTAGAAFAPGLDFDLAPQGVTVFQKGTDPAIDSYSAFFDNGHRKATGLGAFLQERQVEEVVVLGVATDYCVKFTALDAAQLGFRVTLVRDGVRAVNLKPTDGEAALHQLAARGVTVVDLDDFEA